MDRELEILAPAKVNLFLAVGGKRADGFHDVCTVLHAIELADLIRVSESEVASFRCSPDLGLPPEDNLAFRAAQQMADAFSRTDPLAIRVEKHIPWGAGLGGASSDAAAVIVALASLWDIRTDSPELRDVARSIGADVPFFLEGGACLFGGRGDVLERRLPPIVLPVAIVKPLASVATADAYEAFDLMRVAGPCPVARPEALIAALTANDPALVGARVHNNMTDSSAALVPAISDALSYLRGSSRVIGSAMTGSGSACYGICGSDEDANRVARRATESGFWSVATRTRPMGCEVRRIRSSRGSQKATPHVRQEAPGTLGGGA